jgi:tape measure domain-containing protein
MATKPLVAVPGQLGLISGAAGLAANAAAHVAAAFGLASTLATTMAVGLSIILAPLRGLVLVPRLIAASFSLMFAVVLAPFRVLGFAAIATAKAMWMLLQPVLKLAAAIFKLKLFFATLRIQLTLVKLFFGALPPKIRLVVGGLIALGAAGRVGAAAASLVGKAMGAMAFAALAVRSPLKAVGFAALKTALTLGRFTRSVVRATKAMLRFAFAKTVAGLKSVGAASLSVAGNIGGRLLGALKSGVVAIGALAVAGAGWGIKLAADAEQAEIAFTTMLKSGDAARAVLGELETFAASTPFQLNDLRDGAKQLLNAQVPASQLTDKLTMLGDIAAGTGKPIGDFVRIFAKVKATGKVSLETLNQLAERGVPIYTALQQQLGMSREKMLEMISKGKVGFTELNGALTATASGAGVFAGGMAAQSQTVSGLFSTLKDNVGFAMRELGTEIIGAFDFKGLMASGITMFQSLKAGIASARPAFIATATVVKAAFGAVWEVVSVTFNGITAALGLTGGNFMSTFMEGAAVATWAFKQWPNIAQLAFTNVGLWLVQVGAEFVHLFTGVLPALFTWFGSNWKDLFFTAFDLVTTVFINLGRNVRNAMTAIWDFIASGGTASLSIAWTPLTEGFANTISELPNIPDRAIGELERNLISQSDSLANALGSSLAAEIDNNMRILDEFQSQTVETPAIPGITADTDAVVDGDGTGDKKKTRTSFAVDSLDRGGGTQSRLQCGRWRQDASTAADGPKTDGRQS